MGIVGLGYVGLPLAVLAGGRGYPVVGIDDNSGRIASLNMGKSYITDITDKDLQELLEKGFSAGKDYRELAACDIIIVCVPTPLAANRLPDYSYLAGAAREIAAVLRRGQLVIVESTVAPGTTEGTVLPLLEEHGLTAGVDFFLSYSPERIDPGNKKYRLGNIPKLVAGLTPACSNHAGNFYRALGLTVVPVRALAVAEMAKLLENTYRDVNIALVNELARVCRANGIDAWEVIEAAATKPFGFQAFYPGPGVGGHCVPVDTVYYTSWARAGGVRARLAEHARRINDYMPHYVAGVVAKALAASGKAVRGSKILVLGVAYKKDSGDVRESPSLKLLELLKAQGAEVGFHDPFVKNVRIGTMELRGAALDIQTVLSQDCVVLAVAHSTYHLPWLYATSPIIVDLTNALAAFEDKKIWRL